MVQSYLQNLVENENDYCLWDAHVVLEKVEGIPLFAILLAIFKQNFEGTGAEFLVLLLAIAVHEARLVSDVFAVIYQSLIYGHLIVANTLFEIVRHFL